MVAHVLKPKGDCMNIFILRRFNFYTFIFFKKKESFVYMVMFNRDH